MECYSCPLIQWDLFRRELGPYDFNIGCFACRINNVFPLVMAHALQDPVWIRRKSKLFWFIEGWAILVIAPLSMPKMSLSPQWTGTRCSSFKPPDYTASEHAPKRYRTWKTFACKTTDSWPKAPSIESHWINLLKQEEDNKNQHFT